MAIYAVIVIMVVAFAILALFTFPMFQGYRTKIMGTVLALGGGAVPLLSDTFTFLQTIDWQVLLSAKQAALALLFIGVMVVIFRHFAQLVAK